MSKIQAAKEAIDSIGAADLADRLGVLTGVGVSVSAVRKWRDRGIPGEWIPAVCEITKTDPRKLNPLIPPKNVA